MEEEEIRDIQQKKLRERIYRLQQAQQIEIQKKALLMRLLEPEAYERVMNVRLANEDLYNQLVGTLAYLVKVGQIREGQKISEEKLLQILRQMTEEKETKIEFKRK